MTKKSKKEEIVKAFILPNLYKPLSFHISNLSNNSIYLSKKQIKRLLQNTRQSITIYITINYTV